MSDTDRSVLSSAPEMYVHYCDCGKWGSLGWVDRPGAAPTWWCAGHYPHQRVARARQEAVDIAESLGM